MKEFKITEEQIKELAKGNSKVKKWFPEVFEVKLESGKWYKMIKRMKNKSIVFIEDCLDKSKCYGFTDSGLFFDKEKALSNNYSFVVRPEEYVLATEEEVFEALKNEAIKRGFKEGVYFLDVIDKHEQKCTGKISYCDGCVNKLTFGYLNGLVFNNGTWAEIIPTLTKEEAEKKLNVKIID